MNAVKATPLGVLMFAVLLACAGQASDPAGPPPLITSLPRSLSADEQAIQTSVNSFSFELLAQLSDNDPGKNVFVSPLSVSFALGMALNGAAAETRDEMSQTLGFDGLSDEQINQAYRSLIDLLMSLDPSVESEIANSLWHDQVYQIQPTFTDALTTYFDAGVYSRSFGQPQTVEDINGWVSARTHGRIPSIIDDISPDEIMFLINAIYFRGKWRAPFDPRRTQLAAFQGEDGSTGQVPMMSHESDDLSFIYAQDLVAANLAYGNGAFAMALIRPATTGSASDLAKSLTVAQWASIRQRFNTGKAMLRMPRFKLEYKRALNDDLIALGMRRAFDRDYAQFPRMITLPAQLFISRVQHRAAVEVDELGTTAAAVTAVGIGITSAPPVLDFDRPFLFILYEQLSGTILFMGKVVQLPAN
jgi:serpin B